MNENLGTCKKKACPNPVTETQLMIYDESALSPHHKPEKTFSFAQDLHIKIKQTWSQQGVAGVVWDAAVVLCEYLVKHKELVEDQAVLELGAGTGLAGICSHKLGGRTTLTDRNSALPALHTNIQHNFLNEGTDIFSNKQESTTQTEHLDQENTIPNERSDEENTTQHEHSDQVGLTPVEHQFQGATIPSVQILDWEDHSLSIDLLNQEWDVVLGADIIYIESTFPALLKTMNNLKWKTLILSARIRYPKDVNFIKQCKEIFNVKQIYYDTQRDIRIYEFHKI